MQSIDRKELYEASFAMVSDGVLQNFDHFDYLPYSNFDSTNYELARSIISLTTVYLAPPNLNPLLHKAYFPTPGIPTRALADLRKQATETITRGTPAYPPGVAHDHCEVVRLGCEDEVAKTSPDETPFRIVGLMADFSNAGPLLITPRPFVKAVCDHMSDPPDSIDLDDEALRGTYRFQAEHREEIISYDEFISRLNEFAHQSAIDKKRDAVKQIIGALLLPKKATDPTFQRMLFEVVD